jgi:hypothetical protein
MSNIAGAPRLQRTRTQALPAAQIIRKRKEAPQHMHLLAHLLSPADAHSIPHRQECGTVHVPSCLQPHKISSWRCCCCANHGVSPCSFSRSSCVPAAASSPALPAAQQPQTATRLVPRGVVVIHTAQQDPQVLLCDWSTAEERLVMFVPAAGHVFVDHAGCTQLEECLHTLSMKIGVAGV